MKRKFVSTVLAAFTFVAMMSVTALANPAATVRLEAGAIEGGYVDVQVHVDAENGGVSALVVDLQYSGIQRIAGDVAQRRFTTTTEAGDVTVEVTSVTAGIVPTELFPMSFEQFIAPPATGAPMLLYFEMPGNDVLTSNGLAATIRFSVPAGVTGGRVTPVVHTVDGHAFAYAWTADGGYTHLTNVDAGPAVTIGDGLVNIPGDVNLSGETDEADLMRMRQFFARFPVEICHINGDVNGDGVVDEADLMRMRQFFARFPVVLEPYASRVN